MERLKRGEIPIYEPGLDDLIARNVREGRLSFSTEAADAVSKADAVFIAVGTPSRRGDGHADLSYVYAAAEEIADSLDGYTVVVTKSTVPVVYRGSVPDAFKDGREIVVTGRMENGVFQADRGTLITLCPSKFMEEQAKKGKKMPADHASKGTAGT